jgi:hypothetical protein
VARRELPVIDGKVVAFSANSKLGGMACTYRPIGAPSHGGTCPTSCQFLPASRGGLAVPAGPDAVMCYGLVGWARKHQAASASESGSLYAIGRGHDVRLHVTGDFLSPVSGLWDREYSGAVAEWAARQLGTVYVYTHCKDVRDHPEMHRAGVAVWVSCDNVHEAMQERLNQRATLDPYAVGVTLAQPLDQLKVSRALLESQGLSTRYCPWDLSRAHTGRNPVGLISCKDCRLCLDSESMPDVVLFPIHGDGTEGGL